MLNCSELARSVSALPLVESCDTLHDGSLRLSTPFTYPNGEHIDVFLTNAYSLPLPVFRLSDFGKTTHYLRTAQAGAETTARKRETLGDIVAQTGVHFASGDLFIELADNDLNGLAQHILHLAQACARVSDFATHQRLRSSHPFKDDFEEFLDAHSLPYVPDALIMGRHGRLRVDFQVLSAAKPSYILVLGSLDAASAHNSANEIFRKWHDLSNSSSGSQVQRLTVYNSQSYAIKQEDIERLQEYSSVISYPQEEELLGSLLAA